MLSTAVCPASLAQHCTGGIHHHAAVVMTYSFSVLGPASPCGCALVCFLLSIGGKAVMLVFGIGMSKAAPTFLHIHTFANTQIC